MRRIDPALVEVTLEGIRVVPLHVGGEGARKPREHEVPRRRRIHEAVQQNECEVPLETAPRVVGRSDDPRARTAHLRLVPLLSVMSIPAISHTGPLSIFGSGVHDHCMSISRPSR